MKCNNRCISFLDRCWEQYVEKGLTNLPESPESLDVENQASINFLVPIGIVLLTLVCMITCIICTHILDSCLEPNSRQDVANNNLLDNQNRVNRPQPTLIDMEQIVPSGSLTVPVRSTNIQAYDLPLSLLPPSYNEVIKDDCRSEEPPPSYLESLMIPLHNLMANTEESNDPVQVDRVNWIHSLS